MTFETRLSSHLCVVLFCLLSFSLGACSGDPKREPSVVDVVNDAGSTDDGQTVDGGAGDVANGDTTIGDSAGNDVSLGTDSGGGPDGDGALDAPLGDGGPTGDVGASDGGGSADGGLTDADAADAAGTDAGAGAWALPKCNTPTGAPGVAFGPKFGKQLHISSAALNPGKTYTMGLAPTGVPGLIYAEHAGTVYRSADGGCAWAGIGNTTKTPTRMVPSEGGRVYAFYDNGPDLWRIEGTAVLALNSPASNILGVVATSVDGVRLGGKDGQLWDNSAAGSGKWKKVGKTPNPGGLGYRVAISSLNPDRALYGVMQKGFWRTEDGGKSWEIATFQGAVGPQKLNGMNAVFSPVAEDVVWAMAIDLRESLQFPSKTNGKYLWRSTDGGKTFSKAVAHLEQNDVTLTNGVHLIPDATNAAVVRWAFGTCYSGYGTNLYRYDATAQKLSWVNHPIPGITEVIHHPAAPDLLVIGLRGDSNPQCPKGP